MTNLSTEAAGPRPEQGTGRGPPTVLPALCATQIVSWGILYYASPVLNPQITAATGCPAGATTAASFLAPVIFALAGIRTSQRVTGCRFFEPGRATSSSSRPTAPVNSVANTKLGKTGHQGQPVLPPHARYRGGTRPFAPGGPR